MEVLGIDVGGSGIKGAIVNTETGQLVTERHRIPTPEGAKPDDVADEIKQMLEHFNWRGKIGVGFPAVILDDVAQSAGNIDKSWIGVNVGELFKKCTGADFIVANDADVAGLAEINFGAGRNENGLVLMITAGTGIGSGAFYNKQLIPNFELGTFPYKSYKKIEHFAADSARKREKISLKEWAKRLNKFLKIIEKMFTPSLIILGGGSSKKIEQFKNQITIETKVVPAQMLNNAGIVGAAMLCEDV